MLKNYCNEEISFIKSMSWLNALHCFKIGWENTKFEKKNGMDKELVRMINANISFIDVIFRRNHVTKIRFFTI
jgi:hypothetical protein